MPQFSPDQVVFNDGPGLGYWDVSQYREHQQFVQVLAQRTPAVLISDYDDFLQMPDRRRSFAAHCYRDSYGYSYGAAADHGCWRDGLFSV